MAGKTGARSFLHFGDKISLLAEDTGGFICTAGLTSTELIVCNRSEAPLNFERSVFCIEPVDMWLNSDSAFAAAQQRHVKYGQVVKLRHVYTETWLCARKRLQSAVEKNCFRAALVSQSQVEDQKDISFRVLPRCKVRQEGEKVRPRDQVTLGPEGEERYLHASLGADAHGHREVNIAFIGTPWTIHLYDICRDAQESAVTHVCAGQPILLFHKEHEGFLTADPIDHSSRNEQRDDGAGSVFRQPRKSSAPLMRTGLRSRRRLNDFSDSSDESSDNECVIPERVELLRCIADTLDEPKKHISPSQEELGTALRLPPIESSRTLTGASPRRAAFPSSRSAFLGDDDSFTASADTLPPRSASSIPSLADYVRSRSRRGREGGSRDRSGTLGATRIRQFVDALFVATESGEIGIVYFHKANPSSSSYSIENLPFSSNSLWLIENANSSTGGPIAMNSPVRLKHIATNTYLAIEQEQRTTASFTSREPLTLRTEEDEPTFSFVLSEVDSADCLFAFRPLDDGEELLRPSECFVRLQHLESGLWLHTPALPDATEAMPGGPNPGHTLQLRPNTALAAPMARRVALGLADRVHYEDVFSVAAPQSTQLSELIFVLHHLYHLNSYVRAFWGGASGLEMTKAISAANHSLSQLIIFCTNSDNPDPLTREGVPIKAHQALLLDQLVHKVVIQMLKCPLEPPPWNAAARPVICPPESIKLHTEVHQVCILCYRLLCQMVRLDTQHALQLSLYIPFMQTQLDYSMGTADTLMAIFKDNHTLLEQMNEDVLACFVRLSKTSGKQARYLNFLCELCVCQGVGIPKNQDIICRRLLDSSTPLISLRMTNGRVQVHVPHNFSNDGSASPAAVAQRSRKGSFTYDFPLVPKAGSTIQVHLRSCSPGRHAGSENLLVERPNHQKVSSWTDLSDFCRHGPAPMVAYLEVSLNLFANLCIGNNIYTKGIVQRYVSQELLLAVLSIGAPHRDITESFRSRFWRVATHLYVDSPLDAWAHSTIKSWSALGRSRSPGGSTAAALASVKDPGTNFLSSLKGASLDFLQRNLSQVVEHEKRNKLIYAHLEHWEYIVRHRQYTEFEMQELLRHVVELLDVTTDRVSASTAPPIKLGGAIRATRSGTGRKYNRQFPSEVNIDHELFEFTERNLIVMACKKSVCRILGMLLDHYADAALDCILARFKRHTMAKRAFFKHGDVVSPLVADLETIFAAHSFDAKPEGPALVQEEMRSTAAFVKDHLDIQQLMPILLNVTMYSDTALVSEALGLLFRLCSFRSEVNKLLQDVQILFGRESEKTYQAVCTHVTEMKRLAHRPTPFTEDQLAAQLLYFVGLLDQKKETEIVAPASPPPSSPPMTISIGSGLGNSLLPPSLNSLQPQIPTGRGRMRAGSFNSGPTLSGKAIVTEYQDILRNVGVHLIVIEAATKLDYSGFIHETQRKETLRHCYTFLRLFVDGNTRSQQAVFPHVLVPLKDLAFDVGAEVFLLELFRKNYGLCSKIPEELLYCFVSVINHHGTQQELVHRAILFLQEVVVVNNIPVTRCQNIVLKALVEQPCDLLQPVRGLAQSDLHMRCMVAMVELVAMCCLGMNSTTETTAQGLIPVNSILQTLGTDEVVLIEYQRPFLRFLREVWWANESGSRQRRFLPKPKFASQSSASLTSLLSPSAMDSAQWWLLNEEWWDAVGRLTHLMLRFSNLPDDLPVAGIASLDVTEFLGEFSSLAAYLDLVFEGILACLSSFFRTTWCYDVAVKQPEARPLHRANELVEAAIGFLDTDRCMYLSEKHFRNLEQFLLVMADANCYGNCKSQDEIEQHIRKCREWGDTLHAEEVAEQDEVQADNFHSNTVALLRDVQWESNQRFHSVTIDDVPAFTNLLDQSTGTGQDYIIANLITQLKGGHLGQRVTVGMLRLFKQLILTTEENPDRPCAEVEPSRRNRFTMSEMQIKLNNLGITPLMTILVEGRDEVVAFEAVEFGIALLQGGNKVVQDSLLNHFQHTDEHFFASIVDYIKKLVNSLRQRKREQVYLSSGRHVAVLTDEERRTYEDVVDIGTDLKRTRQILRLLQLFCEGHHLALQNYIRQQHDNLHSFNLVKEVVVFLRVLNDCGTAETLLIDTLLQTFNTLTEFCQGPCTMNQATLLACNVCSDINTVLQSDYRGCSPESVLKLRSAAVLTLLSLLEGCNDAHLPKLMIRTISFDSLRSTLESLWQNGRQSYEEDEPSEENEEQVDIAFNLFILMHTLYTWVPEARLEGVLRSLSGREHFISMLGIIEISRGDSVERVYFRKPPICKRVTSEHKKQLVSTVNRESPATKLADYFEHCEDLIHQLDYHQQYRRLLASVLPVNKSRLWQRLRHTIVENVPGSGTWLWEDIALVLALVVNALNAAYYVHPSLPQYVVPEPAPFRNSANAVLSFSLVLISFMIGLILIFQELPLFMHTQQRVRRSSSSSGSAAELAAEPAVSWLAVPEVTDATPRAAGRIRAAVSLLFDLPFGMLYLLSLAAFAPLGLVVSPFFFAAHLLLIVKKSAMLQNVMRSVTANGRALQLTALLGIIIVYFFTLAGYLSFPSDYVGDEQEPRCTTLMQCFVFTLTSGIRTGGGVGELLPQPSWASPHHTYRLIFDSCFYIIVTVILLNIVFGIIIDTFAELRDEKRSVEEDTRRRCFICGIDAYTFDRYADGGFAHHTQRVHNMWHYLHFMLHLKRKPVDEFTGQESYVFNKMRAKDMSFFPLNKATDLIKAQAPAAVLSADVDEGGSNAAGSGYFALQRTSPGDNAEAQVVEAAATRRDDELERSLAALERRLDQRMEVLITNQLSALEGKVMRRLSVMEEAVNRFCQMQQQQQQHVSLSVAPPSARGAAPPVS